MDARPSFLRTFSFGFLHRSCLGFLAGAICLAIGLTGSAQADAGIRTSSALIKTLDLEPTVAWYKDNLGFRPLSVESRTQSRRAILERQGFLLEIAADEHATSQPKTDVDSTSGLGEPVLSIMVQNVDEDIARLESRGVEIVREPQDDLNGGFRTGLITDNGHRLVELREPLDVHGLDTSDSDSPSREFFTRDR